MSIDPEKVQKIGTVCDNYKVPMFIEEFTKADILFVATAFTENTTLFTCMSKQSIIKPIADKVTQFFIDKYKKEN